MKKAYVLDTSAFLVYPDLILRVESGCEVIVPGVVAKELRGLERHDSKNIVEAASTAANLIKLFESCGNPFIGVRLVTGATLRTYTRYTPIDDLASPEDNQIVGAAISLKEEMDEVIVLSSDINMRNIARAYGLIAEFPYFENEKLIVAS